MELALIRAPEGKPRKSHSVLQAKLFDNCIGAFNDGRSAAWPGATPAGCPYGDPLLATAWAYGWRAGQAEQRGRHA